MSIPAFHDRAACRGMDTALFFPPSPAAVLDPQVRAACAR
jgi:hypothetical protein